VTLKHSIILDNYLPGYIITNLQLPGLVQMRSLTQGRSH